MTIGEYIAQERKRKGLTQKDLAGLIKNKDGTGISAQYLNDIELGRRSPGADYLLEQFAIQLSNEATRDDVRDTLYFLAGQLPADLRANSYPPEAGAKAMKAYRKALRG